LRRRRPPVRELGAVVVVDEVVEEDVDGDGSFDIDEVEEVVEGEVDEVVEGEVVELVEGEEVVVVAGDVVDAVVVDILVLI
jgi:hypothetical protein